MTTSTLDAALPLRTAGALPSSRTEDMLADALASNDIDAVKAQLVHVWGHYQSLEFALNSLTLPEAAESFREAATEEGLQDEDPITVALRAVAGPILEGAYDTAHAIGFFLSMGLTAPDALRQLYPDLDHSDPEREVTPEELATFAAATQDAADDSEALEAWERELLGDLASDEPTEDSDK